MECVKKGFENKEAAVNRIKEIQIYSDANKVPLRSYRCELCGKYHLTSMTRKDFVEIKNKHVKNKERYIKKIADYWIEKKGWQIN